MASGYVMVKGLSLMADSLSPNTERDRSLGILEENLETPFL